MAAPIAGSFACPAQPPVPEAVTSVFIGAARTLQNAVKADVVDDQNAHV
jgi:hypothetical protein